jgi:hypothetical protein
MAPVTAEASQQSVPVSTDEWQPLLVGSFSCSCQSSAVLAGMRATFGQAPYLAVAAAIASKNHTLGPAAAAVLGRMSASGRSAALMLDSAAEVGWQQYAICLQQAARQMLLTRSTSGVTLLCGRNISMLCLCWSHLLLQILWKFSIYLEAVAILPQLILLNRTQNIDNLTGNYIFLLGYDPA